MIADRLASLLERPLVVGDTEVAARDAIVVLGAPLGPGDRITQVLVERVDAAAALWRAGGAPLVIASGGVTHGARRAEAELIAEALAARGVPDVIVEAASRTTAQNAREVAALLAPRAVTRIWLVTQPFHGRRAARLFRRVGLEPRVWHIADSVEYRDRRRALRWVAREYAAWAKLIVRRP